MGRKSIDILKDKSTIDRFNQFLKKRIGLDRYIFVENLARIANVYIFSGVIRNFFLKVATDIRDFDLVVSGDHQAIESYLADFSSAENSYGGFKLDLDGLPLDLWFIEKTWAYSEMKMIPDLFKSYKLPETAFFNFSAVVFDFNKQSFIFSPSFETFLVNKEIDLVLADNPRPELCIVNTIYYRNKFHLKISKGLQNYCLNHFYNYSEEQYNAIQLKHFNEIKYPYGYLLVYMEIFAKQQLKKK